MELRNLTPEQTEERMLRDHYAGLAMQALWTDSRDRGVKEKIAEIAYDMAEAMLAERAMRMGDD